MQAGQDVDTARSRYRSSLSSQAAAPTGGVPPTTKQDNYKEEMEDMEAKLEQVKVRWTISSSRSRRGGGTLELVKVWWTIILSRSRRGGGTHELVKAS